MKRDSFAYHDVARILSRPGPLHWRRLAGVIRRDVRGCHLERIPALLQARIRGHGLTPARVQLSQQNEQHGLHTVTSISLPPCSSAIGVNRYNAASPDERWSCPVQFVATPHFQKRVAYRRLQHAMSNAGLSCAVGHDRQVYGWTAFSQSAI